MPAIVRQMIAQTLVIFAIFALAIFLPAQSAAWPAGWLFLILFFGWFIAVNLWLLRHNPGLLQERMRLERSDQKGWDKLLFPAVLAFSLLWLIFMSLDGARFHWSPVPLWLRALGTLLLLGSFALISLVFRENSYLSTVVRVQQDRGHAVVSTGPYHYVRHPMYGGFILFSVGTPLLLGSGLGVLGGLIFMLMVARRAVLEERTLRKELHGYAGYMQQVKYRLIPYVW